MGIPSSRLVWSICSQKRFPLAMHELLLPVVAMKLWGW